MRRFAQLLLVLAVCCTTLSTASAREREKRVRPTNPYYEEQIKTPNTIALTVGTVHPRAKRPGLLGYLIFLEPYPWLGPTWDKADSRTASPNLQLTWKYVINRTVTLGATAGYCFSSLGRDWDSGNGWYHQNTHTNIVSGLFRLELTYLRRGIFTMYGTIHMGIGLRFQKMTSEQFDPATGASIGGRPSVTHDYRQRFYYHVAPLGFRFGRRVGGFLELGYRVGSFAQVGVDYRF